MGPWLILLCAASFASPATTAVVVDVEPNVFAAARALGPEVAFFTARAQPLRRIGDLREAAAEVGTGDLAMAREIQALLRAGGVKVTGGAVDLMRLFGPHHLPSLFRAHPRLRLFVVRARADGREREIAEKGGGVRVLLRSGGQTLGATASRPAGTTAGEAAFRTSFGPLVGAVLSPTARSRRFDALDGAHLESRSARAGHTFVVLHVERDFAAGVGVVSFLYGSGVVVKPDFSALQVADATGRSRPPAAVHAEGRTLELAYEVPQSARGLTLRDGAATLPLAPLLARPAAGRLRAGAP